MNVSKGNLALVIWEGWQISGKTCVIEDFHGDLIYAGVCYKDCWVCLFPKKERAMAGEFREILAIPDARLRKLSGDDLKKIVEEELTQPLIVEYL